MHTPPTSRRVDKSGGAGAQLFIALCGKRSTKLSGTHQGRGVNHVSRPVRCGTTNSDASGVAKSTGGLKPAHR